MSRYHDGLRLAVIRSSSGRTESAPPEILSRGLTCREKERLRSQGFTEAEVAFLNALAEIRNFCDGEEAMRRARCLAKAGRLFEEGYDEFLLQQLVLDDGLRGDYWVDFDYLYTGGEA